MNHRPTRWVVLGLFVFIYIPFLYQHGYRKAFEPKGDFPSLYWGARLAFKERHSPYVAGAFIEAASLLKQRIFPYLYPPPSLLAFYPFTLLSYDGAKLLLLITSHVCILIFIYLFFFKIAALDPPLRFRGLLAALSAVYVLTYHPIIDTLNWGQINLIILALLCLTWYALKRNGHALSIALPLSVAILMKTYPVLLVPLLLIKKRYQAVAAVLALLALYSVIAWGVLPRSLWGDWVTNVLPTGGYGQAPFNLFLPVAPWNHSINGFGTFLQNRYAEILWVRSYVVARPVSYLLSAIVITVTVGLSYLCSRRSMGNKAVDLEISLFLLMMFLVAPLSWEHHLVFILPAALITIHLLLFGGARRGVQLLLTASLFFMAWDFPRDTMFMMKGVWALTNLIKFYAVLTIWVFFVMKLWERLRDNSASSLEAGSA